MFIAGIVLSISFFMIGIARIDSGYGSIKNLPSFFVTILIFILIIPFSYFIYSDVSSPIEETKNKSYISSIYDNIAFDKPKLITVIKIRPIRKFSIYGRADRVEIIDIKWTNIKEK